MHGHRVKTLQQETREDRNEKRHYAYLHKKKRTKRNWKKVLQARYICASLHFLKLKLRDQLLLIFL